MCVLVSKPPRKRGSILATQPTEIDIDVSDIQNVNLYTYNELRVATEGFSPANKIGQGGFGSVYKGKLRNGTLAAIKVLSADSSQGVREFLTEIKVITTIEHENLVKLYGCCVDKKQRILVYEYLENNSLAQTLFGGGHCSIQFGWPVRRNICIRVARGIAFLHEDVEPHIIHRDIKASNILLDKDLQPKISDFGLAKLISPNLTHISTRVAGTARLPAEEQYLLPKAWNMYESGELESLVDALLEEDFNIEEACRFCKIGLLCTQDAPQLRPSMSTVVGMLMGEIDVNEKTITRPGLLFDLVDTKDEGKHKAKGEMGNTSLLAVSGKHSDSSSSGITSSYATMTFTSIYDRSN
ncbi:cold-responsive protein kinase 1 isoform X2 [Senna tora]|uniref:non-specific serine/threonine protein kinase n=1 Tax=Senna tora TaxID=362788 RepID=A0A834TIY2_9FABA|nr:cold-responsive protein kinase 1 isoform X2 [Senna tora]